MARLIGFMVFILHPYDLCLSRYLCDSVANADGKDGIKKRNLELRNSGKEDVLKATRLLMITA